MRYFFVAAVSGSAVYFYASFFAGSAEDLRQSREPTQASLPPATNKSGDISVLRKELSNLSLQVTTIGSRLDELTSALSRLEESQENASAKSKPDVQRDSPAEIARSSFGQNGPADDEEWFWAGDNSNGEFAISAPRINAENIECRGSWCRIQVSQDAMKELDEVPEIAELVLFERLVEAAGTDLEIRQSSGNKSKAVYFATPAGG